MKVLVLGATGAIGKVIVERALDRSHEITAFVRDARKVTGEQPNVRVEVGNVLDQNALNRVMGGHDAVILAVGPGHNKVSTLRTEAARITVNAMTKAGVKRLIALSGLGAGVTRKAMGFMFDNVLARTTLKGLLEDQNGMEAEIRKSKLDWVVVRPGEVIADAPMSRKWVLSLDGTDLTHKIGRQDLALFMLDQLDSEEFVRKPVAIGMVEQF